MARGEPTSADRRRTSRADPPYCDFPLQTDPAPGTLASLDARCFHPSWSEGDFAALCANAAVSAWLLASPRGEPAAYLAFQRIGKEAELYRIAVVPEWRGRGVGLHLLGRLIAAGGRRGLRRLFLEVREGNVAARALYRKVGLRETGRRRSYYREPPEDAVLYEFRWPSALQSG
jgi:ribosomal-protein-alanine N-acetyltransferase